MSMLGPSGVGKTTMAQLIYSHKRVVNEFNERIFIGMYGEKFDEKRLMKEMIESLTRTSCDITELSILENILKDELMGKKLLLVLDSAVNENKSFWDNLWVLLNVVAKGSVVMVTTSRKEVADISVVMHCYQLDYLSENICWLIFQRFALDSAGRNIVKPEFSIIGKRLVTKCEHNIMCIKMLGRLLSNYSTEEGWRSVLILLESDFWNADGLGREVLPVLRVCYELLPSHLKRCFAYSCLFPKGYIFSKRHLVLLWLSQGLIQPIPGRELENIGFEWFDELCYRYFFHHSPLHDAKTDNFIMHELIHDLAQYVSRKSYFRSEDCAQIIPRDVHHFSIVPAESETVALKLLIKEATDLQSFLVISRSNFHHASDYSPVLNIMGLDNLFVKYNGLRTLDLSNTDMEELPCSIKQLGNLYYLGLNKTNIKSIPSEISYLVNLHVLEAKDCYNLAELPESIKALSRNLCHLDVSKEAGFVGMPVGIENLVNLQSLAVFNVGSDKSHCKVQELGQLKRLKGCLQISGLENVEAAKDAKQAKLESKKFLQSLCLQWSDNTMFFAEDNVDRDLIEENVLDKLEPSNNLQELIIRNYKGRRFPSWIGNQSSNLVSIIFDSCPNCKKLPVLGALKFLRHLSMQKLYGVGIIEVAKYPSLEILNLWEMYELKEWPEIRDGDFPRLRSVSISKCPLLKSIPHFSSLKELALYYCPQLSIIPEISSLESLRIEGLQKVKWLDLPQNLTSLMELEIRHCRELSSLKGLSKLTSIVKLEITQCPKLHVGNWKPNLSSKLDIEEELDFHDQDIIYKQGDNKQLRDDQEEQTTSKPSKKRVRDLPSLSTKLDIEEELDFHDQDIIYEHGDEQLRDDQEEQTTSKPSEKQTRDLPSSSTMAEGLVLPGLGWVASPIIAKIVDKTCTFLGADLAKELEDLETIIFLRFELVIKATENSPYKEIIIKCLRRLKNAYYETEDIFDELEYERLESEVKEKSACKEDSSLFLRSFKRLRNMVNLKVPSFSPTQIKLRNQLKNFREVAEEFKSLCELLRIPLNNVNQTTFSSKGPKPSGPLLLNKVIGRDIDRDAIIDLLLRKYIGECSNPAIAITGVGGAGKTTLAQFIFNDPTVINHFDTRIWVCLSPKLDVIKHTKEMIEFASTKDPQLNTIGALQTKLCDILNDSKNTLLVLDDIWYYGHPEDEEWSQLLAPFTSHVGEHQILFTSRSTNLPTALGTINHNNFKELEKNEFKELFRYFVFGVNNSRQTRELEEIGDKIAEKLSRSPMAAKAVASRLSKNLDIGEWRNTRDNVNLSSISDSLLWTYQRLDAQLQRCFLYCSIFPKGYQLCEFQLVNYWISEDFIKCSPDASVKEKAEDYFKELIACSFFQPTGTIVLGYAGYKIHDLFHDLAEWLSKEDCFRIEDDTDIKIPSTVRYISISVNYLEEYIPIILKSDQVRTIYFLNPIVDDVNGIFEELLSKLKKVRVLGLRFFNNTKLPELVGELKHLRYLETYGSSISELPESLSKLYHMQVLLLNESVKKLPDNLSNLIKLEQILMFDMLGKRVGTIPQIAKIGNLTLLETVTEFHVGKENGFELCELGNLKRIKGDLSIHNLENGNKAHALEAKLFDKKYIERLGLVWSNTDESRSEFDLEVTQALQPHENLKHLLLECFCSFEYPSWLLNNSVAQNLYSLTLDSCVCVQVLPSNLVHCENLELTWLLELRNLSHMPELLTSLKIAGCPNLIFASKEEPQLYRHDLNLNESEFLAYWSYFKEIQVFLSGQNLMLLHNPLKKNSEYFNYLETFRREIEDEQPPNEHVMQAWWRCHQQIMDFVYTENVNAPKFILPSSLTTLNLESCNITDGALSDCLSKLTALGELTLLGIMTLTTLPSEDVTRKLKRLKSLSIFNCWRLRSLGFLQGLVSLEKLQISTCPCLDLKHKEDNTNFPASLESLYIYKCVIPDDIFTYNMPNLFELNITECRGSKSLLIGMHTSLRNLYLWGCPDLCKVDGLESFHSLKYLLLIDLPNFHVGSLLDTQVGSGLQTLEISSMEMLKMLSSTNAFASVKKLFIRECLEEIFTFEEVSCIQSLVQLTFANCKIKVLPNSLKVLFGLNLLGFINCPEISSMPELPESITEITIKKCPVLKERCRSPDGPDWPKIAHIPFKHITD